MEKDCGDVVLGDASSKVVFTSILAYRGPEIDLKGTLACLYTLP
jgi:hypothetical protein